ncbi:MAG: GDP-mannose 4,6-dehydratase [Alphaproteobacteria bacterium]|jgi:UDP-glucuronate 4-epimerase|nr:GDP-mannose 4,6-dehydratase [Alphaproteobacteria bacterium]
MPVLVTGVAGFIGYHVAEALLARGEEVLGIDNVSPYYDVHLKEARLERLGRQSGFRFLRLDISDREGFAAALADVSTPRVVHLAAQAGVRHSLEHPFDYVDANLTGHMVILEHCRHQPNFEHLVFASSSSVYGRNQELPFSEADRVDLPASLYAATKRADELMSHAYASLYGLAQTGLRFFTVYGPWGRPDMAMWLFTEAILAGRPIRVFNHGDMHRDFTYIDDIVDGVLKALFSTPNTGGDIPYRVYNIGNHRSEELLHMIEVLEGALGQKAEKELQPMQPGDVKDTFADISAIEADLGFHPTTTIEVGIPNFVAWYRDYHGV